MQVDLEITIIMTQGSLIGLLSLDIIFGFFIQKTYLEQSIDFPLDSECVCKYRVLEVTYSLVNLVCLGKYYAEFV
jgi:hypothetical protein